MAIHEANHPPCSCCGCHGNSASSLAKRCSYSLPPRPPKKPNNSPISPLPTTSSATAALPPRNPKKANSSPTSLFGFSKIPVPTTSSPSVPDPSLPPTFSSSCDGLQEFHVQGDDGFETVIVDKDGDDLFIHLKCPCGQGYNFAIFGMSKNVYYRLL